MGGALLGFPANAWRGIVDPGVCNPMPRKELLPADHQQAAPCFVQYKTKIDASSYSN